MIRVSNFLLYLAICLGTSALGSCASPSHYMGIDLVSASTAASEQTELQQLARRAQAGDKQAQLELGARFEEGRGVPVDLDKARKLYAAAASDSGGTIWVYSPPVGNGTKGRVIPVNTGAKQVGLAEAKKLLARLERVE